jgi:hypothetical protein
MKELTRKQEGKKSATDKDGYSKGENNGGRSNIWGLNYLRDVKVNSNQGEKLANRLMTINKTDYVTEGGCDHTPDHRVD